MAGKRSRLLLVCALLSALLLLPAFAHSGRTDSRGGHYNTSTGEYHYHHGYGEHQHPNGICPYSASEEYALASSLALTPESVEVEAPTAEAEGLAWGWKLALLLPCFVFSNRTVAKVQALAGEDGLHGDLPLRFLDAAGITYFPHRGFKDFFDAAYVLSNMFLKWSIAFALSVIAQRFLPDSWFTVIFWFVVGIRLLSFFRELASFRKADSGFDRLSAEERTLFYPVHRCYGFFPKYSFIYLLLYIVLIRL